MRNFILGLVFGIVVATVGFSGIAHMADKAVNITKQQAIEVAK
jgi:D-serine dehydratase